MPNQESNDKSEGDFNRPWEEDNDSGNVVPLPGLDDPDGDADDDSDVFALADEFADEVPESSGEDPDEVDWEAMAEKPSGLDEFTSDEYMAATTEEYRGLAEEVSRAAEEDWEQQAVAATLPGVESGLVGFEDVSGTATGSEESYEAAEQAASSDIAMRVASGLAIFVVFLGSLLLGDLWFAGFVVLVMIVAVGELYANLRTRGYQPLALAGIIGVGFIGFGAYNWGPSAIAGWAALFAVLTILFFSLTPRTRPLENTALTIMGTIWVGMLAFAILLAKGPHPVAHIVFLVLVLALNDSGAFFVGKAFGRHKLAPNVSPNKTTEGFIGGLIVGLVAASVMVTFPPWESIGLSNALVLAGVIGILAPLGDLSQSMVKRSIGVKDMGSVLPGHGGMLDRIDGFLFAVPAVYFLFRTFELL